MNVAGVVKSRSTRGAGPLGSFLRKILKLNPFSPQPKEHPHG